MARAAPVVNMPSSLCGSSCVSGVNCAAMLHVEGSCYVCCLVAAGAGGICNGQADRSGGGRRVQGDNR